jgi:hypothetical protein
VVSSIVDVAIAVNANVSGLLARCGHRLSNSAVFVRLCPTIAQLQEDNRGLSDASSTELFQRDSASGFAMCGIVSCSSCSFDD